MVQKIRNGLTILCTSQNVDSLGINDINYKYCEVPAKWENVQENEKKKKFESDTNLSPDAYQRINENYTHWLKHFHAVVRIGTWRKYWDHNSTIRIFKSFYYRKNAKSQTLILTIVKVMFWMSKQIRNWSTYAELLAWNECKQN